MQRRRTEGANKMRTKEGNRKRFQEGEIEDEMKYERTWDAGVAAGKEEKDEREGDGKGT